MIEELFIDQLFIFLLLPFSHCNAVYIRASPLTALTPPVSEKDKDKRVTFAPETKSSAASAGVPVPSDWGFRFVVEPLRGVHYRVVRELELICRFGGRARSGSAAASTAGATFGPQVLYCIHGLGMGMGMASGVGFVATRSFGIDFVKW